MFNKKKGIVLALGVIAIYLCISSYSVTAIEHKFVIHEGPQFIGDITRISPEIAIKRGIHGYLKLSCDEKVSKEFLLEANSSITIPIKLEYIAFDDAKSSIIVKIDPHNEDGLFIEQLLGKDKPSVLLNDLVDFDVKGEITLRAGQTRIINATVKIPKDPQSYTIPFGGIGISTKGVGIVDTIEVMLHVQ
jgi:hypothetical protein